MSVTQGESLVVKLGQTGWQLTASEGQNGGAAWKCSTVLRSMRRRALWRAGATTHRMVAVAEPGVAGINGGDHFHGSQSSCAREIIATACKQMNRSTSGALRVAANLLDTPG